MNNKICELKGFEMKRRGELEILKMFQEEVFPQFLCGKTKLEAYKAAADVANRWSVNQCKIENMCLYNATKNTILYIKAAELMFIRYTL